MMVHDEQVLLGTTNNIFIRYRMKLTRFIFWLIPNWLQQFDVTLLNSQDVFPLHVVDCLAFCLTFKIKTSNAEFKPSLNSLAFCVKLCWNVNEWPCNNHNDLNVLLCPMEYGLARSTNDEDERKEAPSEELKTPRVYEPFPLPSWPISADVIISHA